MPPATRLLTVWCSILSVLLVAAIALSTISIVVSTDSSSSGTRRNCHALQVMVDRNRSSIDVRITAVRDREGIAATYTPRELAAAIKIDRAQLADFPKQHCS